MVPRAGKSTELQTEAQTRLSSISCPLVPLLRAAVTPVPKEARKAARGACLLLTSPGTPHACTPAAPNPGAASGKPHLGLRTPRYPLPRHGH